MLTTEIIGNVGSDATTRKINEKDYIVIDVAHSNGKDKPSTWVQVLASEFLAKNLKPYLLKGASVYARGNMTCSVFTSKKDGSVKASISIFANELQLLRSVEHNEIEGARHLARKKAAESGDIAQEQQQAITPAANAQYFEKNDDLPF